MDDTWRRIKGTKVVAEGSAIQLAMETVDGRDMVVQLVPEAVTALVAELVNAKTLAFFEASGWSEDVKPDPVHMRQAIDAENMVITDYVDRDRCLVQIATQQGGIFEFLIPRHAAIQREARG